MSSKAFNDSPLARPGQGERSTRTVGPSLRVVHRRVWHARSEGSEGVAGGVGVIGGRSFVTIAAAVAPQKKNPKQNTHLGFGSLLLAVLKARQGYQSD